MSHLFGRTLREVSQEAEMASHRLLLRAGMIRQLAAGIYTYLPLAWRVLRKIEEIMREEMDAIGGQEISMPVVQPAELWQESGRWHELGPVLFRLRDRANRDLVLGMTHEEVITDLVRREVNSYRQLPFMLYQIQTKVRDEPRPRGGLVRVREFIMKDGYSFHADEADLRAYYPQVYQAYASIFRRCGLDALVVEADPGMMGGSLSHEFMLVTEAGENSLAICGGCDYAANAEVASFRKKSFPLEREEEILEVATPGMKTIEAVADFLEVESSKTLKAIFYSANGEVTFAVIRGDLEVNETKLANALKVPELRLASEEELAAAGLVAGYASPIGLEGRVKVVADDSILLGNNFVAGANREGYHLKNVNYPRDFKVDLLTDIALVQGGEFCPRCEGRLRVTRGIELGHIFQLGTKYSEALGATFSDASGRQKPIVMGCYGIGLGRLMAACVEQNHDDFGIIWPVSIAPYQLHLIGLGMADGEALKRAEELYRRLKDKGYAVLYDDREESAGVKFNDADLIGIPLRLTVSQRTLKENGVEVKLREAKESRIVGFADLEDQIEALLSSLQEDLS